MDVRTFRGMCFCGLPIAAQRASRATDGAVQQGGVTTQLVHGLGWPDPSCKTVCHALSVATR